MVSATGRTIKILSQMLSESKNNPEILNTRLIIEKRLDDWDTKITSNYILKYNKRIKLTRKLIKIS